tara:strand:+ start:339 stop:1163 length:825 start_codon:yes stop_codon:yes gene_type:complete
MDFDKEFESGRHCYNTKVGSWWKQRACSQAHSRAYGNIAKVMRALFFRNPKMIIDYACGTGQLLLKLTDLFPQTQFLGLDGSTIMLEDAQIKGKRHRMHFIETSLPNFSLPKEQAEVVLFTFPHIVPQDDEQEYYDKNGYKNKKDVPVAKYLAKARESNPEEETALDDEETLFDTLMSERVISRNIHQLLKKGGYCIRVEYSNGPREDLTKLVLQRTMFEEGSLAEANGKKPEQLFKVVKTAFFKSKVIEDVFHQTKDDDDKEGGYYVVVLKAI